MSGHCHTEIEKERESDTEIHEERKQRQRRAFAGLAAVDVCLNAEKKKTSCVKFISYV